tara:strand:+ start:85 stop:1209 length:1125 start_codon:yes stop_codon:yes gene_type:complete
MTITKVTDAGLDRSRIVTPLIINGDFAIAQRATSTSSISSNGYHTVDRWQTNLSTAAGVWTQSQDTTVPSGQGFAKSLKMDCTTADSSLAAGDRCVIQQAIEGQNLQSLKKGTSSAESLTVSFWVYATKTGTNIVELYDNDNTRQISKSYTISSSNTWEKKVLNFAGDTTGAFGNDNAASLYLNFYLAAGSTYSSGTLNTSWSSVTAANRAAGQVNHADSTSNNFYITGIQMEVGEFDTNTIPDFPFESFENNLLKCQRYFETFPSNDGDGVIGFGYGSGSDTARTMFPFKVTKRAAPTMSDSLSSSRQYRINFINGSGTASNQNSTSTPSFGTISTLNSGYMNLAGFSSIGGGLFGFLIYNNNTTLLSADAEL